MHNKIRVNMNKNNKKKDVILLLIVSLAYIVYVVIDIYIGGQSQYITYCIIGVLIIALVYLLINIIQLLMLAKPIIARWIKTWCPPLVVILVTIAIPIATHYAFYRGKEIKQDTFLTAYSTYLTFVGAFCLGYFLYKREENRRYEALKKKARLLYETMFDMYPLI